MSTPHIEVELPSGKYLLVKKIVKANDIRIDGLCVLFFQNGFISGWENLPSGHTYTIIGKGNELTFAHWVRIIESEHDGSESLKRWYKNYENENCDLRNPIESGHSLIRSKWQIPEEILIIKMD